MIFNFNLIFLVFTGILKMENFFKRPFDAGDLMTGSRYWVPNSGDDQVINRNYFPFEFIIFHNSAGFLHTRFSQTERFKGEKDDIEENF